MDFFQLLGIDMTGCFHYDIFTDSGYCSFNNEEDAIYAFVLLAPYHGYFVDYDFVKKELDCNSHYELGFLKIDKWR